MSHLDWLLKYLQIYPFQRNSNRKDETEKIFFICRSFCKFLPQPGLGQVKARSQALHLNPHMKSRTHIISSSSFASQGHQNETAQETEGRLNPELHGRARGSKWRVNPPYSNAWCHLAWSYPGFIQIKNSDRLVVEKLNSERKEPRE